MDVIEEELVNALCPSDCVYRAYLSHGVDFCAYSIMAHEARRCRISECDKYRSGIRKIRMDRGTLDILMEFEDYE